MIGKFILLCFSITFILLVWGSISQMEQPKVDQLISSCVDGWIGGVPKLDSMEERDMERITSGSVRFDIIIPNGECKNDVIMSAGNYTKMQNNVGYFTVKNKTPVTTEPTHNWCPLETWIWDGHTGYYNVTKYQKWMLTPYCDIERNPPKSVTLTDTLEITDSIDEPVVIPEFGTIVMMILVVAISLIVIVNRKQTINNVSR